ncbi:MAG: hypothetical protein KY459_06945 [Acidobacteria bacterium]|nr:hypothetical protein [Acidobacteriota bacterium]
MTRFKTEGAIEEITLQPALMSLADDEFTGAVRFERDGELRILYFQDGNLLSAGTSRDDQSIETVLIEAGRISRDHVDQAFAKRQGTESIGEALLRLGFVAQKELRQARRAQLVRVINELEEWNDGSYTLIPDYVSTRSEGSVFTVRQIILEAILGVRDRARFESETGVGSRVFRLPSDFDDRYKLLGLNDAADRIVSLIDGKRSGDEIAAESGSDSFLALKLLHGLATLGLVVPVAKDLSGSAISQAPLFPSIDDDVPDSTSPDDFGTQSLVDSPDPAPLGDPEGEAPPGWHYGEGEEPEYVPIPGYDDAPAPDYLEPVEPPVKGTRRSAKWPLIALLFLLVVLAAGWWFLLRPRMVGDERVVEARSPAAPIDRDELAVPATGTGGIGSPTDPGEAGGGAADQQEAAPPEPQVIPEVSEAGDPTPVAPPAAAVSEEVSADRARHDRMAAEYRRELATVPYTVQFEIVCQTASVNLAEEVGGAMVWWVPISFRGEPCYRVFWGRYETRAEAEEGSGEIPERLRDGGTPVVIDVARVFGE